jgi:hypothetical protein
MLQLLVAANIALAWNHPCANVVAGMQASLKSPAGARSAWEVAQDIFFNVGVQGFWSGYLMSVLLSGSNATMLYFYEVFRDIFDRLFTRLPGGARIFIAAMLGRIVSVLMFQPLKVLRSRMQAAAAGVGEGGVMAAVMADLASVGPTVLLTHLYAGVGVMCMSEGVKIASRILVTEKLHGVVLRLVRLRSRWSCCRRKVAVRSD